MEIATPHQDAPTSIADNVSDYGSDLDEDTAQELLSQAESQPLNNIVLESIEEPAAGHDKPLEQHIRVRLSQLRQSLDSVHESSAKIANIVSERQIRQASVEVEYDECNRKAFSSESGRTVSSWSG